MRAILFAALVALWSGNPARAVVSVDLPNTCADRNALQGVALDARLTVVKFFYKGLIGRLTDKARQNCLEARVLFDDNFAVINRTRDIVETKCLPIDIAADMATHDLCP
jgi:hypothetical protein